MKERISVLGAGRMGSALVRAFLNQGYGVDVWNRTKSKGEQLAALGARVAPTVQDAVAAAEIVVVNVNDYLTSDRLLRSDQVTDGLRGKLLVQLTSGTPRQAKDAAAWASQHGIAYLDGAIMATPNFVGGPECTILYSGAGDSFEKHKPVFLALGANAVYLGSDPGHASTLDIAMLTYMWGGLFGALQAAAICKAENFPLDAYAGSVKPFMTLVDGWALDVIDRIQHERFSGETSLATVDTHHAVVRHLLALCKEHGINRAVPDAFDQLLQAAAKAGHGQEDFAVLAKFMR